MFWIFAGTSFHSFILNLYLVNAFGAKEISEIHCYHILLNVLGFLIVGIVVAECIGDTLIFSNTQFSVWAWCEKVSFSLIHPTHITIHSLRCQLSVKVTFKQTVKNNDYWTFLIFFAFTFVFFLELDTRDGWIVQRVHLYIWAAAGHELKAIVTRAQSFNLWLIL